MSDLFGVTTDYLLKDASQGNGETISSASSETAKLPSEKKWLGMTLVIVCSLCIFGMWAVVELENVTYIWGRGAQTISDDGLVGYLCVHTGMIPVVLSLILGVIGGIRILMGKPFWCKVQWLEDLISGEHSSLFSEETRRFLEEDDGTNQS